MTARLTTSHASRQRRWLAVTIWAGLIVTAMILWNGRTRGDIIGRVSEDIAFLLAAFIAFVSLFAWMLYNPARGVSAETPTLFLAAAATLFPPCVIGFSMIPMDSPVRFWLAGGLFLLLAIAVMSPVPDEFFGIPRDRHSYLQPTPFLEFSQHAVEQLNPDWLRTTDLSAAVPESRPSLAPSAWRYQDRLPSRIDRRERKEDSRGSRRETRKTASSEERPRSQTAVARDRQGQSASESSVPVADAKQPRNRNRFLPIAIPGWRRGSRSPDEPGTRSDRRSDSRSGFGQSAVPAADRPESQTTTDSFAQAAPRVHGTVEGVTETFGGSPSELAEPDAVQMADQLRQQEFERVRDKIGGEMIEGTMPVHFVVGQKRANVHIPFTPALPGVPEVECESVDGEVLRLKVPERRPWGIRIEARRSDASGPLDAEIGFAAIYTPPGR